MLLVGRLPSFIAFGARLIAQPLNYSGNIVGQIVGRFRSPETVAGPPSLLFSQLETVYTAHYLPPGLT